MGAEIFRTRATGSTLDDAFTAARDQARYEHGHGGYSGTIAEKDDVIEIAVPGGVTPAAFAAMVYAALEDFYGWQAEREEWDDLPAEVVTAVRKAAVAADNKWGPAVAIPLAPDRWVIMGWAPS